MPQAPTRLRNMFNDDGEAWAVLVPNFIDHKGLIHPKDPDHVVTEHEGDALDYLWLEWDYAYSTTCNCTASTNKGLLIDTPTGM